MIRKEHVKSRVREAFSELEEEYLAENLIGRLATSSESGQPHVVPVTYRFDGEAITFGGWNLAKSLKFRNLMANDKVAFVVDDLVSTKPWHVRGVEIRGRGEPVRTSGGVTMVRIIPLNIRSWGLGD
ncbi:MAG TPA: PPOX class F420-dependent oxidoreductase [Nitrososphaerales archaeon]|nr:PPOX class F420-dependent oxidoreductase [Nitrososphaerales archaeon]